jgi:hypothetical protein
MLLRIDRRDGRIHEVPVQRADGGWRPQELLWAPDSRAFFINGSASAYAGFSVVVYVLSSVGDVRALDVTSLAQRDMVRTFPPCKVQALSRAACTRIEQAPEYNVSAITWTLGGRGVVVVAEIPCSSLYGGIMCQVMGYELEIPTGRIVRRMNARDLKRRYQGSMTWDLRIPEPPIYR